MCSLKVCCPAPLSLSPAFGQSQRARRIGRMAKPFETVIAVEAARLKDACPVGEGFTEIARL